MRSVRIATSIFFALVPIFTATHLAANDSAASVAAGGIQLRREARIAMKSEKLFISRDKIRVEYEFLNETAQDITTEVAFPIPEYGFDFDAATPAFDDFRVWVENSEVKYGTEAKAIVNGKDVSSLLVKYRIDLKTFGHFGFEKESAEDFAMLPAAAQEELVRAGLFKGDEGHFPAWRVQKTYHWTQTFPAGKILHVRHEYKPMAGFRYLGPDDFDAAARKAKIEEAKKKVDVSKHAESDKWELEELTEMDAHLTGACIEPALARSVAARVNAHKADPKDVQDYVLFVGAGATWVDYILTTANSWKTPIGEFELTVEKPASNNPKGGLVLTSFCWDGPVEKLDATHFVARAHDFVPKAELHIFFFDAY